MNYSASRLASVQPSASVIVSQQAKQLIADGYDVIDLGLGEPDFETPKHIIEAAHQAALRGETLYPPIAGTAKLKEAIIQKFSRDNSLNFDSEEIIVSNGVKTNSVRCFNGVYECRTGSALMCTFFLVLIKT